MIYLLSLAKPMMFLDGGSLHDTPGTLSLQPNVATNHDIFVAWLICAFELNGLETTKQFNLA